MNVNDYLTSFDEESLTELLADASDKGLVCSLVTDIYAAARGYYERVWGCPHPADEEYGQTVFARICFQVEQTARYVYEKEPPENIFRELQ